MADSAEVQISEQDSTGIRENTGLLDTLLQPLLLRYRIFFSVAAGDRPINTLCNGPSDRHPSLLSASPVKEANEKSFVRRPYPVTFLHALTTFAIA